MRYDSLDKLYRGFGPSCRTTACILSSIHSSSIRRPTSFPLQSCGVFIIKMKAPSRSSELNVGSLQTSRSRVPLQTDVTHQLAWPCLQSRKELSSTLCPSKCTTSISKPTRASTREMVTLVYRSSPRRSNTGCLKAEESPQTPITTTKCH